MKTTVSVQDRTKKRERLKELTAKIKNLLWVEPKYRENDALLVNRIQRDEMIDSGLDVNTMLINDFFRLRLQKRVSSGDSITRIRREVQEYYPETRGDNYKKRQSKQIDVQSDLHEIENHIKNEKSKESNSNSGAPLMVSKCQNCGGTGEFDRRLCAICNGNGEIPFQ